MSRKRGKIRSLIIVVSCVLGAGLALSAILPAVLKTSSGSSHPDWSHPHIVLFFWNDIFEKAALESEEVYFPLSDQPAVWMFDLYHYSDYGLRYSLLANYRRSDPEALYTTLQARLETPEPDWDFLAALTAESYVYFGYAVRSEDDLKLLKQERSERTPENVQEDIVTKDGRKLYRLRGDVESELISEDRSETAEEIRASIPILVENPNVERGHPLDELHVLYLDGTIEAIPFGEKFPATQALIDFLKPE